MNEQDDDTLYYNLLPDLHKNVKWHSRQSAAFDQPLL